LDFTRGSKRNRQKIKVGIYRLAGLACLLNPAHGYRKLEHFFLALAAKRAIECGARLAVLTGGTEFSIGFDPRNDGCNRT
jgi:hypothetical protein